MQDKTWYSILGLDAEPLFLQDHMLSVVLLLISNLTNGLRFHQFLVTKSEEENKSVKNYANEAH